ncbi:hypothetical protein [Janthinobacterium sp. GW458P]|uniref:hypothetical protein n=1 Tax=Janthinobacterium sp. GW458P TaxID=1981504 RepID=UPI001124A1CB|nr:hypothetical protein [Janthinobacterium sp. GW458P]MBE3027930.1 hypothetical protein [Janthinobacterium sp. GW458P]
MSSTTSFGAANASDLAASIDILPTAGIGPAFSFERAAGKSIDQVRHACKDTSLPLPTATCVTYVFCSDLERASTESDFDPINLVWTTDTSVRLGDIENRIVLISRNGGAGCRSKNVFVKMSDHANALAKMGFGASSALIFQLHSSVVTLYHDGIIGNVNEERAFGTVSQLLIGDALEKALDYFDDTWLNAQLGHAMVWAKNEDYTHVPAENTEKLIQNQLQLALSIADMGSLVMHEILNPDGRADLLLKSETPAGTHSVVLELKVLRSFSFPKTRKDGKVSPVSDATNEASALEVVKQAYAYRKQFTAYRACARLYDMRKSHADTKIKVKSKELADKLSVELWVSEIHRTVQDKRNAKVAKELASSSTINSGK